MTANEMGAVAMMEKLKRIWVPAGTPQKNIWAGVGVNLWFKFRADIGDGVRFEYDEYIREWALYSTEPYPPYEQPDDQYCGYKGYLIFDSDCVLRTGDMGNISCVDSRTQFTRKWLLFFRRNCWLSGCYIECSQQERLEWVQVLPRDAALVLEIEFKRDVFTRRERLELLELRDALPREFWPKTWLDEEQQ